MFRYTIKYLNFSLKNKRIGLAQGMPNEEGRKIKLYNYKSQKEFEIIMKKSIGKDKYDKKQTRRAILKGLI